MNILRERIIPDGSVSVNSRSYVQFLVVFVDGFLSYGNPFITLPGVIVDA